MQRAILVILDGLRRDLLSEAHTPRLTAFAAKATSFAAHRSVFPSTTRVASACIATGCRPGLHELTGNSYALPEPGGLVLHDAGHPDFLQHKRRVTGRALGVQTLAELLADYGGAVVFSNVSPGAAYAQDPDGFGSVYHRAGSFGPGRMPVPEGDALTIGADLAGDRAMAERFISEVLQQRRPTLAVLWLGHPDTTQHAVPLGSPEHLRALAEADRHAGMVMEAVAGLQDEGDDCLLIIGSDHGHQTVTGTIDIVAELVAAGLKADAYSTDVLVAPNGTAALIYLDPEQSGRAGDIAGFLKSRPWADRVLGPDALPEIGHCAAGGLAIAIAMRTTADANQFGIAGTGLVVAPQAGKGVPIGCGQHGGLGEQEQSPFLCVAGPGFVPGRVSQQPTSPIDVAPTVLAHLGLAADGMDGQALQYLPTPSRPEAGENP